MNINKEQIDELNVVISLEISEKDYDSQVKEVLRDYRRKASMPGFRPGKVPEGLVRKLYGKAVLIDELNKLVSESLQNYIKDQQLSLLGDPLPNVKNNDVEWEIGNNFTFDFEVGLTPVVDFQLSKEEDRITMYQISVEKDMVKKEVERYTARFGQFVETDAVVDFTERLEGNIVQLGDDGQPLPDGLSAEETSLMVSLIKEEEYKKPFENAKMGDEIVFNLSETFSNVWEIASILRKRAKEEVGDISGSLFRFIVTSVRRFSNAELNQDLFDKVFGEGAVVNIEEFEDRIEKHLAANFEGTCFNKFCRDVRKYLVEKVNPPLPEEYLRKWMLLINKDKGINEEIFEKEFPKYLQNMKWDLIVKAIARQHEINLDEQEIINFAKMTARQQLAMYGMDNPSEETLQHYAMNSLKDEKNVREIASQALERKIVKKVSEIVDLNMQEISMDDFNQMINASNNEEAKEVSNEEKVEEVLDSEEAGQAVEVKEEVVEEVRETEVAEINEGAEKVKKSRRKKNDV